MLPPHSLTITETVSGNITHGAGRIALAAIGNIFGAFQVDPVRP
jgi:hypothetical protein